MRENNMVSRIDGPSDEEMTVLRAAREEQKRRAECYDDLLAALRVAQAHFQELREAGAGGRSVAFLTDCEARAHAAIVRATSPQAR